MYVVRLHYNKIEMAYLSIGPSRPDRDGIRDGTGWLFSHPESSGRDAGWNGMDV
jgi:hypothetical protein